MKANFVKGLNFKVNLNPIVSISSVSQPEPLKLNLERFFNNVNLGKKSFKADGPVYKKLIGNI